MHVEAKLPGAFSNGLVGKMRLEPARTTSTLTQQFCSEKLHSQFFTACSLRAAVQLLRPPAFHAAFCEQKELHALDTKAIRAV